MEQDVQRSEQRGQKSKARDQVRPEPGDYVEPVQSGNICSGIPCDARIFKSKQLPKAHYERTASRPGSQRVRLHRHFGISLNDLSPSWLAVRWQGHAPGRDAELRFMF